jgi:hypothetical protein
VSTPPEYEVHYTDPFEAKGGGKGGKGGKGGGGEKAHGGGKSDGGSDKHGACGKSVTSVGTLAGIPLFADWTPASRASCSVLCLAGPAAGPYT